MPGANCSVFGCSSSRRKADVAIFKVPAGNDEYSSNWRKKLESVITKDRVIDQSLKKQLENRTLHICEKHFSEDQLLRCKWILAFYYPLINQYIILIISKVMQLAEAAEYCYLFVGKLCKLVKLVWPTAVCLIFDCH